jgi:hypothetical protein
MIFFLEYNMQQNSRWSYIQALVSLIGDTEFQLTAAH